MRLRPNTLICNLFPILCSDLCGGGIVWWRCHCSHHLWLWDKKEGEGKENKNGGEGGGPPEIAFQSGVWWSE